MKVFEVFEQFSSPKGATVMFPGSTDSMLAIAERTIRERHEDADRARTIRESFAHSHSAERRIPRVSLRLPKFDLPIRFGTGRTETA